MSAIGMNAAGEAGAAEEGRAAEDRVRRRFRAADGPGGAPEDRLVTLLREEAPLLTDAEVRRRARLMAVDRRATPFEPRDVEAVATRNKHEFCGHTMTRGKAPGAAKRRAPDAPSHGADVALQQSAAPKSLQRGATRGKIKRAGARRKTA